jgi:subtilisin family serine protease
MSPVSPHQACRVNTSSESLTCKCGTGHKVIWTPFCLLLVAWVLLSPGLAGGGILRPPAPPQVAPVISEAYPGDLNANRINDDLESAAARTKSISIATSEGQTGDGRMVAVELIFNEPVTQGQIDSFLALGGQIRYLFKAISYGWNGRIAPERVKWLPVVMGPSLVQVEPIRRLVPYMDLASRTGRVRPIWQAGFAGNPAGLQGDPNTTIAFIDTGVDGTHTDLAGRCAYWRDFTDDNEPSPVDYEGHGSLCAGVALGTGKSGGAGNEKLRYTYVSPWSDSAHLADPISLPIGLSNVYSAATWEGDVAALIHVRWTRGTLLGNFDWTGTTGGDIGDGVASMNSILTGTADSLFSTILLASYETSILRNVVIVTTVSSYPGTGDGFNKFSGVAPGCRWAAAKIQPRDGLTDDNDLSVALDDLVVHRMQAKIKIISISYGVTDDNDLPIENVPLRDQINTAVNNGIIVVAAAGNSGEEVAAAQRKMADPPRAAMAITVGAVSDENILTSYSSQGFDDPCENEDCKPDVLAPGGSMFYTGIMSVDSGTADSNDKDHLANDYTSGFGTSFAAPFVAGSAALVIEALERQGIVWDFSSSERPRYVKMLLCATASETNAKRETGGKAGQPTLQRAANGPNGFPSGKDPYEGYGIMNPDAAVEGISQTYEPGSEASVSLGNKATEKRVWARTTHLTGRREIYVSLDNPSEADFDLYLYSMVSSHTGTPVILASSTNAGGGTDESLRYSPASDVAALLVVKRVSGTGTFTVRSSQAAPPVAQDVNVITVIQTPTTVTLRAADDGSPIPPGAVTYIIASLPQHGRLEDVAGGTPINQVPRTLPANQVIYRPEAGWVGQDSFTFLAEDGGTVPFGGKSNTATVRISVQREMTVEYQVSAGADDVHGMKYGSYQELNSNVLIVGESMGAMRFRGIQIPQGATIKSATLSICSYTFGLTSRITGKVQAEAADNPGDFTVRRISNVKGTAASRPWNWDAAWSPNTWYESPDIGPVLQEVIDRPGWSPANAIVILYTASDYEEDRRFWSCDGAPDKAARLKITFQPK